MGIKDNIEKFRGEVNQFKANLIAVSKTHPVERIREAYDAGQRIFGENKVQEMADKQPLLPADIQWHLIGHLQRNKVKYIAPFVSLIHSVDSLRLLEEINKQGQKAGRLIHCLLQVYIAKEETKFGLDQTELFDLIHSPEVAKMEFVKINGLMGIATLTENQGQIRQEFKMLKSLFESLKSSTLSPNITMKELSMGMSADYKIALEEGSTLVRIGTAIFGERNYSAAH
ncbi:MAG: YggS family pyridoxal phosphate-dependent enzyme [Cyclobacteriaceae bacterium]|nr:YggS family pyridoxal phosphate-dependent enzyme [Cyclobacteriaceae bacterium]